jgi:hypothetical protein
MNHELLADVLCVNVRTGFGVVNQIPSRMIRIVINNDVVRASPAPIGGKFPIAWKHFKAEPTVEPEPVEAKIKPGEAIRMRRPEIIEAAMLIWMIHMEARVVPVVVAIPLIIGDVWPLIHSAVLIRVVFRWAALRTRLRCRRDVTAIPTVLWRRRMLLTSLRINAHGHQQEQANNGPYKLFHNFLQFKMRLRLSNEQREYPIH